MSKHIYALHFALFLLLLPFLSPTTGQSSELDQQVIAGAKTEGEVSFYGSMSIPVATPMIERFEKKYPFIKVKHYRGGSDRILNKILTEAKTGSTLHDIVQMRAVPLEVLKSRGLLEKFDYSQKDQYSKGYFDPEGFWIATDINTVVIIYNRDLVPSDKVPRDWEDLLKPEWKGKITMDHDDYEWYANMLAHWGRGKGLRYMQRLASQDIALKRSHNIVRQMVSAGEFPLGITYAPSTAELIQKGAPLDWVHTTRPIVGLTFAIGMAKKAPHPNAAKVFINYVLSKENQEFLATKGRIPVRSSVDVDPLHLKKGIEIVPGVVWIGEEFKHYQNEFARLFKEGASVK